MTCATVVSTHAHTQTSSFWPAVLLAQLNELKTCTELFHWIKSPQHVDESIRTFNLRGESDKTTCKGIVSFSVRVVGPQMTPSAGRQRAADINYNKLLSYRRETALQGALQFLPKVEEWNWETIFYGHHRSIFNHCDIIGLKIRRIPWKKTQNKGYYGVQGHSRSSR